MEKENQSDISAAQAVLLGALAPGVNVSDTALGPTWNTLKSAFLLLGLCLAVMLGLAFTSSDSSLILHVGFLVLIAATLFLLLSWMLTRKLYRGCGYYAILSPRVKPFRLTRFLSQTGFVSIEHQMREMDLVPNDRSR